MTRATVTQAGAEYLGNAATAAQVAQAGVEYLFKVSPGSEVTQAGAEYLFRVQPSNSVTQVGAEILYKEIPCTGSFAQIWTITRDDGEVYRFTSLDRNLVFGGNTYLSCNSMTPSASEAVAEVGTIGSLELEGIIGTISMFDLHSGKFDGARVEAWLVPWEGTTAPKSLICGTFGKVDYSETGFRADILGDGGRLQQTPLVRPLQPDCRWLFGDGNCTKDVAALTVTGTVDTGSGQRGFTDAARAETAGYFSRGRVTFTSGDNTGITAEIKLHETGGVFTLWPRLPFSVETGDEYEMIPGCTNLLTADGGTNGCTAWSNTVNYGGFPNVRGSDFAKKTPDVKKTI